MEGRQLKISAIAEHSDYQIETIEKMIAHQNFKYQQTGARQGSCGSCRPCHAASGCLS